MRGRSFATEKTGYRRKNLGSLQCPKEQTLWYYRSLAEMFCERLPGQLSDELHEIVEVLEAEGGAAGR